LRAQRGNPWLRITEDGLPRYARSDGYLRDMGPVHGKRSAANPLALAPSEQAETSHNPRPTALPVSLKRLICNPVSPNGLLSNLIKPEIIDTSPSHLITKGTP
jgi:hypothetical protein